MKKNIIQLLITIGIVCLSSCSDNEDTTPSQVNDNLFAVTDGANDEESVMRRSFYESTGVYLLFNDTLRHVLAGKDAFGDDYYDTQTINFNYSLTSTSSTQYRCTYYDNIAKKQAALNYLKSDILTHFEGKTLLPYSILLLDKFEIYERNAATRITDWWPHALYNGWRCLALAFGDIADQSEDAKKTLSNEILITMINSALNNQPAGYLENFHSYSASTIDQRKVNVGLVAGWDLEALYPLGYIVDTWSSFTPTANEDLSGYVDALVNIPENEFLSQYAQYPIIIAKYQTLKSLIENLGFKF